MWIKVKWWCLVWLLLPAVAGASESYPRLANYYLSFFTPADYQSLARWDLLIVQPEMARSQAPFFAYYRARQPAGKLLAYLYPAMFFRETIFYDQLSWRRRIFDQINAAAWWLRDEQGKVVEAWPNLAVVDLTNEEWRRFNINYLNDNFLLSERWDGLMYDLVDAEVSYYSKSGIDLNKDGQAENAAAVNERWQAAMAKLLRESRQLWPDKIILINGNSAARYQPSVNGRMFENFPTSWEGNGSWADSMRQYLTRLPGLNQPPAVYVLNATYRPAEARDRYQQMRFGLTSAMLGDGYFSFDSGEASHSQQWWFDEYNLDLGRSLSAPYNLLSDDRAVRAGLWRRDFAKGIVLVNSTNRPQTVIFQEEKFKRLAGVQEPLVNDGQPVKRLVLCPADGIILLRATTPQPILDGDWLRCQAPRPAKTASWETALKNYLNRFMMKWRLWQAYYFN